jgi:hypothetical protein
MTPNSTAIDDASIDALTDPETLRDRPGIEFREETHTYETADFASIRSDLAPIGGWVVVGVTNDEGRVLLMDDGTHGWTLPAVSVREEEWLTKGQRAVEGLTDRAVAIDRVERVRRIDYKEDGGDGHVAVRHVVCRAAPVEGTPVAADPTVGCDGTADADWFDTLPDGSEGVVADDARLFFD